MWVPGVAGVVLGYWGLFLIPCFGSHLSSCRLSPFFIIFTLLSPIRLYQSSSAVLPSLLSSSVYLTFFIFSLRFLLLFLPIPSSVSSFMFPPPPWCPLCLFLPLSVFLCVPFSFYFPSFLFYTLLHESSSSICSRLYCLISPPGRHTHGFVSWGHIFFLISGNVTEMNAEATSNLANAFDFIIT